MNRYEAEVAAGARRRRRADARRGGRGPARAREGGRARDAAADRGRRRNRRRRRLHRVPRRLAARGPHARGGAAPRVHRRCARRVAVRRADLAADRGGSRRVNVSTPIVIDCDPGHDDAIAILLALASPEVELRGVVTVAGNQTLDKTTRNALKVLELAGRADIPVVRRRGPRRCSGRCARPRTCTARAGSTGPTCRSRPRRRPAVDPADWLEPGVVLVPTGPLTNVARLVQRGVRDRAHRLDGRRDRRGEHHAGGGVQRVRRPGGGARRSSRAGST